MRKRLNFSGRIMQVQKHTRIAAGANTACDGDDIFSLGTGREVGIFVLQVARFVRAVKLMREGIGPGFLESFELTDLGCAQIAVILNFWGLRQAQLRFSVS